AIERPDDALSVFATLRGPFFAIPEEGMLAWHSLGHGFRPFGVPEIVPPGLEPIAEALRVLRDLTRRRNHRPVAETIGQLLECTRAHVGFIFWRGGEQVLANVLQVQELARQYEAEGGLSFRAFVDELRDAAERSQTPEAPILEEGTEGVRLMTVHKAKGLEFPVVILADIGCKLHRAVAQRHLDTERGLAAVALSGWTPLDLSEHNDVEIARDRAEAIRLAYVAATRARDVLVIPAIGDGPFDTGWISPLANAIYPPDSQSSQVVADGLPTFNGRDTVLDRPDGQGASFTTMRPAAYRLTDPCTGEQYSVVWWDPLLLDLRGEDRRGIRREDLITKEAKPEDVAADRARYDAWKQTRAQRRERAAQPSLDVVTATEFVKGEGGDGTSFTAGGSPNVTVLDASVAGPRPSGRRFGVLVHALLAAVPLDAAPHDIRDFALLHARILGAPDDERDAATAVVESALTHEVLQEARAAASAGRACRREAPISIVRDGTLIDGQIDLAYESAAGEWNVVDFKTDADLGGAEDIYRRQVALYAEALAAITGTPARATILRV
ncbi:MAG: ATP-dependent deoxyribonuclease subunit A, partial [Acidobacteria bacterium]|nr:ATP-dependent deoxyribonuclease subunit A [Acidobacteriota bacterium]